MAISMMGIISEGDCPELKPAVIIFLTSKSSLSSSTVAFLLCAAKGLLPPGGR